MKNVNSFTLCEMNRWVISQCFVIPQYEYISYEIVDAPFGRVMKFILPNHELGFIGLSADFDESEIKNGQLYKVTYERASDKSFFNRVSSHKVPTINIEDKRRIYQEALTEFNSKCNSGELTGFATKMLY